MQVIFIVLCGILMGAFNLGFFMLGYYVRDKKPEENAVELTKDNAEALKEIMRWVNYGGE